MNLTFVRVSEKRYLVVAVEERPSTWTRIHATTDLGFLSAANNLLTSRPVTWAEAVTLAAAFAVERGEAITAAAREKQVKRAIWEARRQQAQRVAKKRRDEE